MSSDWADRNWHRETHHPGTANEVHEVMTSRDVHIGYMQSADVADHVAELHNRTLGDGQDPPPRSVPHGELGVPDRPGESRWAKELRKALDNAAQDIAESTPGGNGAYDYLDRNRPAMVRADDIRQAFIAGYQWAQADAAAREARLRRAFEEAPLPRLNAVEEKAKGDAPLSTTEEPPAGYVNDPDPTNRGLRLPSGLNLRRPYSAQDMRHPSSRTLARIDITQRLEQLISDLVHQRVTEYAAREPARIVIGNPVAMANMLVQLGWKVEPPEDTT